LFGGSTTHRRTIGHIWFVSKLLASDLAGHKTNRQNLEEKIANALLIYFNNKKFKMFFLESVVNSL
jgi:hypothetical protein